VCPEAATHTHAARAKEQADHRRCHPKFCSAIDPAMPCLNGKHVEELAGRCFGFSRDRVLEEFADFVRTAVTRFPGIHNSDVFSFGRALWDAWAADTSAARGRAMPNDQGQRQ